MIESCACRPLSVVRCLFSVVRSGAAALAVLAIYCPCRTGFDLAHL
jgi:hypothetical protein